MHHHPPLIPLSTKPVNSDLIRKKIMPTIVRDWAKTKFVRVDGRTCKVVKGSN